MSQKVSVASRAGVLRVGAYGGEDQGEERFDITDETAMERRRWPQVQRWCTHRPLTG